MPRRRLASRTYETRLRQSIGQSYALSSLDHLRTALKEPQSLFLVPTFVITACVVVEAAINDNYIDHFHHVMGDDYMRIARPLLYLNFRERLSLLFPVISDWKFVLNEKHERVRALLAMFELRGRMIHVKHHYRRATLSTTPDGTYLVAGPEIDASDPYDEYLTPLKRVRVNQLYLLTDYWRMYLDRLVGRIRRRNFNPHGLLIRPTPHS